MSRKTMVAPGEVVSLRSEWRETILVCRKCSRKLGGGFGPEGELPLRAALRASLRERGARRDVRVAETGCFGVCPKNGVTMSRSTVPGELLVVGRGTDPARLLDRATELVPETAVEVEN